METKPTYWLLQGIGLSCIRDDRVLFEGLTFELVSGQVLLLEGKNGSGKTSLLRILCGFREPDAGEVFWCGDAINISQYYEDMAYVGHLDGVKKELTVLENLKVSLALGRSGQYSIQQALTKVHLTDYDDVLVQVIVRRPEKTLIVSTVIDYEKYHLDTRRAFYFAR
jgi:heme exporter protein A